MIKFDVPGVAPLTKKPEDSGYEIVDKPRMADKLNAESPRSTTADRM